MIVKVSPAHLAGAVAAPPSKSLGHRALLCAGLAHGSSRLTGISDSQDMLATLDGLAALGAQAERAADGALLVRGAPLSAALETATALTDESICRSLWRDTPRRFGVDFEGALPAYIRRVEKIFEA